jgi:hypothetical protein
MAHRSMTATFRSAALAQDAVARLRQFGVSEEEIQVETLPAIESPGPAPAASSGDPGVAPHDAETVATHDAGGASPHDAGCVRLRARIDDAYAALAEDALRQTGALSVEARLNVPAAEDWLAHQHGAITSTGVPAGQGDAEAGNMD